MKAKKGPGPVCPSSSSLHNGSHISSPRPSFQQKEKAEEGSCRLISGCVPPARMESHGHPYGTDIWEMGSLLLETCSKGLSVKQCLKWAFRQSAYHTCPGLCWFFFKCFSAPLYLIVKKKSLLIWGI